MIYYKDKTGYYNLDVSPIETFKVVTTEKHELDESKEDNYRIVRQFADIHFWLKGNEVPFIINEGERHRKYLITEDEPKLVEDWKTAKGYKKFDDVVNYNAEKIVKAIMKRTELVK